MRCPGARECAGTAPATLGVVVASTVMDEVARGEWWREHSLGATEREGRTASLSVLLRLPP